MWCRVCKNVSIEQRTRVDRLSTGSQRKHLIQIPLRILTANDMCDVRIIAELIPLIKTFAE